MDLAQAYDPIRALGSAWRLIVRAPLAMLLGGVLVALTDASWSWSFSEDGSWWEPRGEIVLGTSSCCCVAIGIWMLNCLLQVGLGGAVTRVMFTGEEDVGDVFRPRGLWVSMLLASAIQILVYAAASAPMVALVAGGTWVGELLGEEEVGFMVGLCLALAYVPILLYVVLGALRTVEAVAIEGLKPVDALQRSWEMARGNRLRFLLYYFVTELVGMLGLCLCCAPVVLTAAWVYITRFESYVRFALPVPEGGLWIDGDVGQEPVPGAAAPADQG